MKTSVLPAICSQPENLKPGVVLISRKKNENELLNQSVILLLEHDETGSTGIILNKPAYFPDKQNTDEPLYYGGVYDTHRVGVLLNDASCAGYAIAINEELFYCERCETLSQPNFRQALIHSGKKAFIGLTVWQAAELEQELGRGNWWISNFYYELLMRHDPYCWEKMSLRVMNSFDVNQGIHSPLFAQ